MLTKRQFTVRLSEKEYERLVRKAQDCGLSMSAYMRQIINGYHPKEAPSMDFYRMMRELKQIGNNLNQIAYVANNTGLIDEDEYHALAALVRRKIRQIEKEVLDPERDGDH